MDYSCLFCSENGEQCLNIWGNASEDKRDDGTYSLKCYICGPPTAHLLKISRKASSPKELIENIKDKPLFKWETKWETKAYSSGNWEFEGYPEYWNILQSGGNKRDAKIWKNASGEWMVNVCPCCYDVFINGQDDEEIPKYFYVRCFESLVEYGLIKKRDDLEEQVRKKKRSGLLKLIQKKWSFLFGKSV